MDSNELKFMKYAIALGYKGLGNTLDNPSVGAILVKNGKIIGKGYTQKPPGNHAEVEAIKNAIEPVEGSTLYVTLEPCSFFGRTPACTTAIIKNKIKKVVIGSIDPNPKVSGKGIEMLRQHGIEVKVGVLNKFTNYLHRFFFYNLVSEIPYITLKYAQTLDVFIAKSNGYSKWISNEFSRRYAHKLRKYHDAILIGYKTYLNDKPLLNVRYNLKGNNPIKILYIKNNDNLLNYEDSFFLDGNVIVAIENDNQVFVDQIKENVYRVYFKELKDFLKILKEKFQIYSLLVEGGAKTLSIFFNNDLFNEVNIIIGKKIFKEGISPYSYFYEEKVKNLIKFNQFSFREDIISIFLESNTLYNIMKG